VAPTNRPLALDRRCGPDHNHQACYLEEKPFCSSSHSYCGKSEAHRLNCQTSYSKDGICGPLAFDRRCGPDHNHQACYLEEEPFCSSSYSYCGKSEAHRLNCQTSYSKDGRCEQLPDETLAPTPAPTVAPTPYTLVLNKSCNEVLLSENKVLLSDVKSQEDELRSKLEENEVLLSENEVLSSENKVLLSENKEYEILLSDAKSQEDELRSKLDWYSKENEVLLSENKEYEVLLSDVKSQEDELSENKVLLSDVISQDDLLSKLDWYSKENEVLLSENKEYEVLLSDAKSQEDELRSKLNWYYKENEALLSENKVLLSDAKACP
jgi:hypothetical protein